MVVCKLAVGKRGVVQLVSVSFRLCKDRAFRCCFLKAG